MGGGGEGKREREREREEGRGRFLLDHLRATEKKLAD